MADSPDGVPSTDGGDPVIVSIPEMPDRMVEAGLPRVGAARVRQLAAGHPGFPKPIYVRGRVRLWRWDGPRGVERFFRERELRPGARTDLEEKRRQDAGEAGGA